MPEPAAADQLLSPWRDQDRGSGCRLHWVMRGQPTKATDLPLQLRHDMPGRSQVLDDAAERFVDGDVRIAGAAGEGAGEHLADLAEQMLRADGVRRERVQIFGALGADAFLMVGEEAG